MQVQKNRVPVDRVGSAHVAILVGGAFQSSIETPESLRCDLVIYIDVASEIRAVRAGNQVLLKSVATGETIGTLMLDSECDARLREYCEQHSAVNLADGLAQIRGIGDLVMKMFVETPEFREFARQHVFGPLLIMHNGAIDELTLLLCASGAGATGGPGLRVSGSAIRDLFLEHSDATVQQDVFRCGSLTYEGVGDRVHANNAATLVEDVAWATSSDRHPSEVRRLFLTELPMVEENREARGRFAREVAQAICAEAIRRRFGLHAPNAAFDSRLGAINILRGHFHRSLSERDIAAEVAHVYQSDLRAAINAKTATNAKTAPGAAISIGVELAETNRFRYRCSIDDIVRRATGASGTEPAGFQEDCTQVLYEGGGRVTAELSDQRVLNVTDGARAFASRPCETIADYKKMFSETKALETALKTEIQSRQARLRQWRTESEPYMNDLTRLRQRLFPKGWVGNSLEWLRRQIADPNAIFAELRSVVEKIRRNQTQVVQIDLELRLIRRALTELAVEHAAERVRLQRAIDAIAPLGAAERSDRNPLITVQSIDDVLTELVDTANDDSCSTSDLIRLLSTRVSEVTIHGLARIARLEVVAGTTSRAATIAGRLDNDELSISAPPWGGNRCYSVHQRVMVLPPISIEIQEEIKAHLERKNRSTILVRGDSASAGANVVNLEIFSPHRSSDVFTKFVLKNLEVALEAPELFFPNGTECVEELGLWELLNCESPSQSRSNPK